MAGIHPINVSHGRNTPLLDPGPSRVPPVWASGRTGDVWPLSPVLMECDLNSYTLYKYIQGSQGILHNSTIHYIEEWWSEG